MLRHKAYVAAFPLHDGNPLVSPENGTSRLYNLRRNWARFGSWYKFQPLDLVRGYFGEAIGNVDTFNIVLYGLMVALWF
jgi:hypothetical protein